MADGPGNPAGGTHESGGERSSSNVRDQDRFFRISNISRIMKKVLTANERSPMMLKILFKNAFLSLARPSDRCLKQKRKTFNGDDLLGAMATLGFEYDTLPLKACLSRHRED